MTDPADPARGYLSPRELKAFWIGFAVALIGAACGAILGFLIPGWF